HAATVPPGHSSDSSCPAQWPNLADGCSLRLAIAYDPSVPAKPGDPAPTFILPDVATDEDVTNPWTEGQVVLAFFKVSCPVCQLAAPKVQALADGGVRVTAIGEDPAPAIVKYAERYGQ